VYCESLVASAHSGGQLAGQHLQAQTMMQVLRASKVMLASRMAWTVVMLSVSSVGP